MIKVMMMMKVPIPETLQTTKKRKTSSACWTGADMTLGLLTDTQSDRTCSEMTHLYMV